MGDWLSKGCEACRQGILSGSWPPPRQVAAQPEGPIFLHVCDRCGSWWEVNLREAHVIDAAEAREKWSWINLCCQGFRVLYREALEAVTVIAVDEDA